MRSPQRSHTEGFNWRLYAGNASYAGHRTVTDGLNADGNIFAPSILLAEAESGYRAVFHKIQDSTNTEESRSTRRQHHKRRPETPGVGPSQRGPQASYKKGIYEDGSREVLAASGEPRWHGSVFERFDTSRESRDGAGATSSYQSEAPPAFFVRNLHPEGIYAAQNPFWDEAADDDIPSYGNRPLLYGYGDPDKKYK
ncbi:hypothetical protein K439DRAFT_723820 [Ramaria rubella]|nr:hypothetical protein K439DRAFT_723820 [Ramaria rubella]